MQALTSLWPWALGQRRATSARQGFSGGVGVDWASATGANSALAASRKEKTGRRIRWTPEGVSTSPSGAPPRDKARSAHPAVGPGCRDLLDQPARPQAADPEGEVVGTL